MRLGSVATLLLLSSLLSLPVVAAQAPPLPPAPPVPEPDPGEVVELACATLGGPAPDVRDALPVCPRVDPAGPAPADEQHVHDPAPVPGTPQDVAQLASDVLDDAQKIPEDPAGAPERVASIVATVVQFLRDLLGLPVDAAKAVGGAIETGLDAAGKALADAACAARDAASEATQTLGDAVNAILDSLKPAEAPRVPAHAPKGVPDAGQASDGLLDLARGEVGQVLAPR